MERGWGIGIQINGEPEDLGYFIHEIEAARSYDGTARKYRGAFANLNFPEEAGGDPREGKPLSG
jgi:hypothetical protein